jgi:CheY-like chemotaxis protein
MAGFVQLGHFAHSFEALLESLRNKKLRVNAEIVDVLLAGNDCLRTFVAALKNDANAVVDCASVEAKVIAILGGTAAPIAVEAKSVVQAVISKVDKQVDASNLPNASLVGVAAAPRIIAKRNILVCDDDADIRDLLQMALEDEGYAVATANNGEDALRVMKLQAFDIIFTDYKMPDMNGLEFVQAVRQFNPLMPIIVVSGASSRKLIKEFFKFGVGEFIDKPFSNDAVVFAAGRAIRARSLQESMLGLTRLCFRVYVSVQRMDSMQPVGAASSDLVKESKHLSDLMLEMKQHTAKLLEFGQGGM